MGTRLSLNSYSRLPSNSGVANMILGRYARMSHSGTFSVSNLCSSNSFILQNDFANGDIALLRNK